MIATYDILLSRFRQKDLPFVPKTLVKYGYLYNYYAANDVRNICSSGWHLANTAEIDVLNAYLGYWIETRKKLCETGTAYWLADNNNSNSAKFNARGNGQRSYTGDIFYMLNQNFTSWLTNSSGNNAQCFNLSYEFGADYQYQDKKNGYGVRIIKDTTTLSNGQSGTYTGTDGKLYRTICIGTQEWLADNLCETQYRNGDLIPVVTTNSAWAALTTGARCVYNNDQTNAYSNTTAPALVVDKLLGRVRQYSRGYKRTISDVLLPGFRYNDFAIPANALVNEDGTPVLDENGNYIIIEN